MPVTSETLAKMMSTNPVVVRRTMAGLRQRGFVKSEKGHGGGWKLSCNLGAVTLYDIYKAIGSPTMLAIGNRSDSSNCVVEKAVNVATENAFLDAENMLTKKFRTTTLAELHGIIKEHSHT